MSRELSSGRTTSLDGERGNPRAGPRVPNIQPRILVRSADFGSPATEWTMRRELHLNLFIHSRGHHEAAWRHPASSELALTDIEYYQGLAQRAEAALFNSIFFADQLALGGDVA